MFCAAFRRFVWYKRRVLVVGLLKFAGRSNSFTVKASSILRGSSNGSELHLKPAAQFFVSANMSPRGKAKAKKDVEENGKERRMSARESRKVKTQSYKDLSDSEEDKPIRRRKKDSDSESASEEEKKKPKRPVQKGRKASARSRKEVSDSEEASDFASSEESSGADTRKRKKSSRTPARSLRTPAKASYKDLSNSEDDTNDDEEDESSSGKEEKKTPARGRGRPAKSAKKSKKAESSEEDEEEEDVEDEEEEEEEEEEEDVEDKNDAADKPKSEKSAAPEASPEKAKEKVEKEGSNNKNKEDKPRPEHELSEEEEDEEDEVDKEKDVKKEKDGKVPKKEKDEKPTKKEKDANDTKKRGRVGKTSEDSADEENDEEPLPKKAKAVDKPMLNKTDSDYGSIDFTSNAKTKDGDVWNFKISSWNVAGLKAWIKKNGLDFIKHESPDILCLQETKCSEKKLPPEAKVEGYNAYWLSGEKEGYAGVAILSKTKPIEVKYGVGNPDFDTEGRVITAEYEKFFLVNTYVPNAGQGLKTLPKRLEWDPIFRAHLKTLDEKKPVILCGDLNVAHDEIDLANPKTNTKSAGFTPQEREGMTTLLKEGFVDTFRNLYPDKTGAYSFWTYMSNARSRNVGWRLDYFVTSERFLPNICDNVMRSEVFGSDHCPITLFTHI